MAVDPYAAARNGVIGGVAGTAGALAARAAMANPEATAIIAATATTYAYMENDDFRECVNDHAYEAYETVSEYVGEPDNDDRDHNTANGIGNYAMVGGIAASVATGNPAFAYAGIAAATGAQAMRAREHDECSIQ